MKILLLTFYFEPDLCAGSFRATSLFNSLNENYKNLSIDVLTTTPNRYKTFEARVASNVEEINKNSFIYRIKVRNHKSGFFDQSISFISFFLGGLKFIKRNKDYDLIIATSSRLMTGFLGAMLSKRLNVPYYLDLRDIFSETIKDIFPKYISFLIKKIVKKLENFTIKGASKVNLVSKGFEKYFFSEYPEKVYSFYTNGVDEEFINFGFSKTKIKITNNINKRIILYAGNIGKGQGLDKIIPQLALNTKDKYEYKIIGEGGAKADLEKKINLLKITNVEIINPISRSELIKSYKNADILFLHLNDFEVFKKVIPSKIFEYAATKKPIVAGVSGYSEDFIKNEIKNAFTFMPCSHENAINVLKKVKYVTTNRSEFIEKYSRKKIMNSMSEDIISLVKNDARKS